jgi:hypothetical protein
VKVGDLVLHKKFKGSIGLVLNRVTWSREPIYEVMWFKHYYDTGKKSPVYKWEVEIINESR